MKSFIIKDHEDTLGRRPWEEVVFTVNPDLNLSEIIESFERFLRAAGYYFDGGHLEIVEEKNSEEEYEDGDEEDEL